MSNVRFDFGIVGVIVAIKDSIAVISGPYYETMRVGLDSFNIVDYIKSVTWQTVKEAISIQVELLGDKVILYVKTTDPLSDVHIDEVQALLEVFGTQDIRSSKTGIERFTTVFEVTLKGGITC